MNATRYRKLIELECFLAAQAERAERAALRFERDADRAKLLARDGAQLRAFAGFVAELVASEGGPAS